MVVTLRDEQWGYTPIYLAIFIVTMFLMAALAIQAIGSDDLSRDQFNLGDDHQEDLETTARRFESIDERMRRIEDFKRRREEGLVRQAPQVKKEPPRTLLLITAPGWCKPCAQIDKQSLPVLTKRGWIIKNWGSEGVAHIWVINIDVLSNVANQFNGEENVVPLWVLVVDGKVTKRQAGFLTAEQVQSFYRTK